MALRGSNEISNHEDILDSRDIIARIGWLQPDRDALVEAIEEEDITDDIKAEREQELVAYDESEEGRELKTLIELQEECDYGDWKHGSTLIHEKYFTQYAKDFADDIGDCKEDRWPYTRIDWDAAADDLKQDYTEVDFDGETYYLRA